MKCKNFGEELVETIIKHVNNRIKYTCSCGYFKIVDGGK